MLGRADIDGSEDALMFLNDTESAWHREIRLARARGILQEQMLTRSKGPGSGSARKPRSVTTAEFFTVVGNAAISEGGQLIEMVQPAIRADQFLKTVRQVLDRIMTSAGYSPTTLSTNLEGSAPTSGVALAIRERQTQRTVAKKRRYWEQALRGCREALVRTRRRGQLILTLPLMSVRWPDTIRGDTRKSGANGGNVGSGGGDQSRAASALLASGLDCCRSAGRDRPSARSGGCCYP